MVAAVNDGNRTSLLTEKHLTIRAHHVEIAVNEHRPGTESTPERLLTIEVKIATAVNGRPVQGIVGTLEMAVLITGIACPVEGIEIQATDKTDVFG